MSNDDCSDDDRLLVRQRSRAYVTEYSYTTEIEKRYRDFDTYGHVNNAVYVTYLESARIDFFRDVIGEADARSVVAHVEVDYESSIQPGEDVTIALAVTEIGTSSVTIDYEIRADDAVAATASTTQVLLDEDDSPRAVPEAWRERLYAGTPPAE